MIINEETKANAQATLDYILMNPEKHNQSNWVGHHSDFDWNDFDVNGYTDENICGTTMCAAGTIIMLRHGVDGLNAGGAWTERAAPFFGFESESETDAMFYNMSEEKVIMQLTALANGDEKKFWENVESAS